MLYIRDTSISNERMATIADLNMLIDLAEDAKYKGTDSGKPNMPIITGDIYIDNDELINESYIKNTIIDQYYPDLHIFVKNVRKAYSAKFIKIDGDNYEIVGTQKVDPEDAAVQTWFTNPYTQYASLTSRDHYDFNGWSTAEGDTSRVIAQAVYQANMYYTYNQATKAYTQASGEFDASQTYYYKTPGQEKYTVVILTTDSSKVWENQTYAENVYEYNFYIIYNRHKYLMKYLNMDNSVITTQEVPYGDYLVQPAGIPAAPAAMLAQLAFDKTYTFRGYNTDASATEGLVLSEIASSQDLTFHAIFAQLDVHDADAIYPEDAFNFTAGSYNPAGYSDTSDYAASGWVLTPKPGHVFAGKITLPVMHNGDPVVEVRGFGTEQDTNPNTIGITHIFFEQNAECKLRKFGNYAFAHMESLKYIEIPDSVRALDPMCCLGLIALGDISVGNNVHVYNSSCFANSFVASSGNRIDITLPGDTAYVYDSAFANLGTALNAVGIGTLTFGGSGDPTQISYVENDGSSFSQRRDTLYA